MWSLGLVTVLVSCAVHVTIAKPIIDARHWHWNGPAKTAEYIGHGKKVAIGTSSNCDLSQASMPQGEKDPSLHSASSTDPRIAPTPLPSPASGLSLSHVAIGRGTQNYTCDLSNSTAVPVAVGAVASLFNVSCLAVESPDLVSAIPPIALDLPVPSSDSSKDPSYFDLSGYHYFLNTTTAFFNLDTSAHTYGMGAFKKANQTSPPTNAMAGPNGSGNGAVAWLKLSSIDGEGQVFQEVYRLNTAGGNPPKTCAGQQAAFEVPYAAEYWLYT